MIGAVINSPWQLSRDLVPGAIDVGSAGSCCQVINPLSLKSTPKRRGLKGLCDGSGGRPEAK